MNWYKYYDYNKNGKLIFFTFSKSITQADLNFEKWIKKHPAKLPVGCVINHGFIGKLLKKFNK